MANQITHRRMSGGTDHEHIIRVKGPGFDGVWNNNLLALPQY